LRHDEDGGCGRCSASCAFWDRADADRKNIPTIVELIDHPDVIEMLVEETRSHSEGREWTSLSPSDHPKVHAAA